MNTYKIESVNGKTCRHRGGDEFEAAIVHIRAHITRRMEVGPRRETIPSRPFSNYWSAVDQEHNQKPVRQPFLITRL